jgi:anion-transporting  ArsA/GET3 family ATPase
MPPQARVVIFCGKGGVGKTTLCLAHALRHSSAGRRVVVVTSHPLAELAVSVSLEGLEDAWPSAAQNLFVVHLDPRELVAEVVRKNFPVALVAGAILRSSLYRNLIDVAPGLKEFYFLVRLQQLAERKGSGTGAGPNEYDLLLWDAPASGHFLATLRSARHFETYLTGPLAVAGAELSRFFSNALNAALLPVTTLEEMAIAETIEMCGALRTEMNLEPAAVLMNLVSPAPAAAEADLERLRQRAAAEPPPDPALRFAIHRALLEADRAASLRRQFRSPVLTVQRLRHWSTDLEMLSLLGDTLADLPAGL